MKIFIEGDLQIKSNTEVEFKSRQDYIEWVLNNPNLNNEDTIYLSLGDFFDSANPNPIDYQLGLYYLQNLKCKQKIIIAGNHDYNRLKNSYSIDPLQEIDGVTLIKKPDKNLVFASGDYQLKAIVLPYYYDYIYDDLKSMREEYESYEGDYDVVFGHIEDETQEFGSSTGIDISKLKGTRIQGHIHIGGKGYLESPVPNKTNEMLDHRYVYLLDIETKNIEKVEVPDLLRFETVRYPDLPKTTSSKYLFLDILDSIDRTKTEELYSHDNTFIRSIRGKQLVNSKVLERSGKVRTVEEMWKTFKTEKEIDKNVAIKVEAYV